MPFLLLKLLMRAGHEIVACRYAAGSAQRTKKDADAASCEGGGASSRAAGRCSQNGFAAQKTVDQITALQPDLIVTAAYGQILPKAVLEVPSLGCINVHGSLLPNIAVERRFSALLLTERIGQA